MLGIGQVFDSEIAVLDIVFNLLNDVPYEGVVEAGELAGRSDAGTTLLIRVFFAADCARELSGMMD